MLNTSSLGKRPASEVQEDDMSGVITTPEPVVRPKRGRPPSKSKLWEDNSRTDIANISSSLGPGDTTVSITSPEKTGERPPPEDTSLDYEAPSQVAQRDKLLRMLQNPGKGKNIWEPSCDDDDDASVIMLSRPPPPKKARPAKVKPAPVVESAVQNNVPPRPRPKPRKKARVSKD
ncbi:hypothetical protein QCA50_018438 [Cerrena zonata]|uniref:Uncharacterized protein n=1 Tax=Cerrena zonata TaxID=2478898 RepID=A0AAW0FD61_9APHY